MDFGCGVASRPEKWLEISRLVHSSVFWLEVVLGGLGTLAQCFLKFFCTYYFENKVVGPHPPMLRLRRRVRLSVCGFVSWRFWRWGILVLGRSLACQ